MWIKKLFLKGLCDDGELKTETKQKQIENTN